MKTQLVSDDDVFLMGLIDYVVEMSNTTASSSDTHVALGAHSYFILLYIKYLYEQKVICLLVTFQSHSSTIYLTHAEMVKIKGKNVSVETTPTKESQCSTIQPTLVNNDVFHIEHHVTIYSSAPITN